MNGGVHGGVHTGVNGGVHGGVNGGVDGGVDGCMMQMCAWRSLRIERIMVEVAKVVVRMWYGA